MSFTVETEREEDGRWLAEIPTLPGAMAYGRTRDEAIAAVKAIALHVIADRIEHGDLEAAVDTLSFHSAA